MPQFILDMGEPAAAKTFNELDSFTQGYVEAMFWTDTGSDHEEEGLGEDASFAELAPDSLARIVEECRRWQEANATLLQEAYERDYSEERAGHDYWLTRNGHGAGFWDREELEEGKLGDKLSKACEYRSRSIYRGDDDLIYYDTCG